MVKIPSPEEQAVRPVGLEGSSRSDSLYQLGSRFEQQRDEMLRRTEPTSLPQLEKLARKTVAVMQKHQPPSDKHFPMVMELLRMQYNLNFAMVCELSEDYDELAAPER